MKNKSFRKFITTFLLLTMIFGNFSNFFTNEAYASENTKKLTIDFEELLDGKIRSEKINIPFLSNIISVKTNTGNVDYTIDGEEVSITVNGGSPSRSVNNPNKYSMEVSDSSTNNTNSFSETKSYSDVNGYSGVLTKNGEAKVISGTYLPAENKSVTESRTSGSDNFAATIPYNSGGFSGNLSKSGSVTSRVVSGIFTPADTKFVTNQASASYNSGGYVGTLEKYVHSGTHIPRDTKTVTGEMDFALQSQVLNQVPYNADGYSGTLYLERTYFEPRAEQKMQFRILSTNGDDLATQPITKYTYLFDTSEKVNAVLGDNFRNSYLSDLRWVGGVVEQTEVSNGVTYYFHRVFEATLNYEAYVGVYTGTITRPESDTRVYRYQGNVTKPAVDTRVWEYTQNYSGIVTKPAVDTRTWQQNYLGTAYKAGIDDYYSYTVTLEYYDDITAPNIEINPDTIDWTNKDITLNINAMDTESGVRRIQNHDDNWVNGDKLTYVVSTNGDYSFKAEDNAGNISSKTISINNIDKVAPSLSLQQDITAPTNTDVIISITSHDNLSGIKEVKLSNGVIVENNEYIVSQNGTYDFIAIDKAGNTTTKSISITNIDKVLPVITIDDYIKTPINQNITVTAKVDKGTLNKERHTFTENGSFEFIATDVAGNVTKKIVTITNIDKLPPVITIGDYIKTPTNKDITVTATTNEGTLNKTSHTFTENGSFEFVATDEAGNVTKKEIVITNIDKVVPTITIDPYNTNWTNKDVTVTAKVDKGTLNKNSHTFTENGSFEFVVTDVAGNTSKKTVVITNIDKVAPTTPSVELDTSSHKLVLKEGTDGESGVDRSLYSINDGEWINLSKEIDISNFSDGDYTIILKTIDKAGNESTISLDFEITYQKTRNNVEEDIDNSIIGEDTDLDDLLDMLDGIQEKIDKLPNGNEKDKLQDMLNKLEDKINEEDDRRLEEAIKAVELAEATRREPYIQNAKDKVAILKDSPDKTALEDRIRAIEYIDKDAILLADAIKAVEMAEATKREPYIQNAKDKVAILKDSPDKTALEDRIRAIEYVDDEGLLLKEAIKAVEIAESTKRDYYIENAQEKVSKLKDGENKTSLENRIEKIILDEAIRAVELAETTKREPYIQNAKDKVAKLRDSLEKTALQDRIKAILEKGVSYTNFKDAELAVALAEATKRDPYITRAKDKVRGLEFGTSKEALELRLFNLEELLSRNTPLVLENAERVVSIAEDLKRDSNLIGAREAINRLKPCDEKTEFLIRLETVAMLIEGLELNEEDIAIITATHYVEMAELYDYYFVLRKAYEIVDKLPHSEAKIDLLNRLNDIEVY